MRRSSKKSLAGTADTRATEASSSCPGSTSCTPPQPSARTRRRSSPVHVYFSTADLPHDADLHALREFKKELNAPYSTYSSSPDVASQVVHALEDDLPTLDSGPAPSPSVAAALDSSNSVSAPARAKLGVHHEHETQAIGTDKRGKMKYRHVVRDLVIDNSGDATSEDLRFKIEHVSAEAYPFHLDADADDDGWVAVGDLTEGSQRSWTCFPLVRRADVQVATTWLEGGKP